ncbi:hypothetical protein ACFY0G_09355 [Streptomyces sp. NPDC001552]|uniref:hypothetical protein n=1 Tax=Streptomyces sp. NPDC001552 TaxID=3364587 RepID=UPI00368C4C3C
MATTKKTGSKTFADTIAEADLKAAEKAAQARTELAELRDNVARWRDEHAEAAQRVQWIRGNFHRGKEVVDSASFAEALANEERLKLLSGHGQDLDAWTGEDRRVRIAEKNLPPAEKKLAAAIASALGGALPGAEILSTFGKVEGSPAESDLPVAVVSQGKATYDGTRGEALDGKRPFMSGLMISGEVEVTLYRKPEHRELFPPKIAKHLAKEGVTLAYTDALVNGETVTRSEGEYEVDTLRLTVERMGNPSASPELKSRYAEWIASRQTSLTAPTPQSGRSIYAGI